MGYKVNATRDDDGSYALSYGKGSKKLGGVLRNGADGWWLDQTGGSFAPGYKTKREAIAAWGTWAASKYEGGTSASAPPDQTVTTSPDAPHAPHSGPPKYKRPTAPAEEDDLSEYTRDFFTILSVKRGRLTEWQLAQCRCELRKLLGLTTEDTDVWIARQRDRVSSAAGTVVRPAPAGPADAPATAAASPPQAEAAHHPEAVHAAIPPVPRRPRPHAVVPGQQVRSGEEQPRED